MASMTPLCYNAFINKRRKMKIGTKFRIGYKAKKYNGDFIWRDAMWTEDCKIWTDKKGQTIFTYWDIANEGFRSATNDWVFMTTTVREN